MSALDAIVIILFVGAVATFIAYKKVPAAKIFIDGLIAKVKDRVTPKA